MFQLRLQHDNSMQVRNDKREGQKSIQGRAEPVVTIETSRAVVKLQSLNHEQSRTTNLALGISMLLQHQHPHFKPS